MHCSPEVDELGVGHVHNAGGAAKACASSGALAFFLGVLVARVLPIAAALLLI